jgi:hypothetical protein
MRTFLWLIPSAHHNRAVRFLGVVWQVPIGVMEILKILGFDFGRQEFVEMKLIFSAIYIYIFIVQVYIFFFFFFPLETRK